MRRSLTSFAPQELQELFVSWGHLPVHAERLLRRVYANPMQLDLTQGSIPKLLQQQIAAELRTLSTRIAASRESADGTVKLLVECADGARVESVLMPDYRPDRAAGCISTQVGCAMACSFCATGLQGFSRNLTAAEIVEQFLHLKTVSEKLSRRLSTIVLMGMGEPLLNLANVVRAVDLIAGEQTGHLGHRQITISTVGLIPQLRQFVAMKLNVQLALSLHAPDDLLRARIIPPAKANPITELLQLASEHQANTGRVAIVQYCLFQDLNDSDEHAHALGKLMAGRQMHINLLSYNTTGQLFTCSSPQRRERFTAILRENYRLVAHARRSRGEDIAAACGQLSSSPKERATNVAMS